MFSLDPLNYHPILSGTRSGRRFEQILRCLNCSDNDNKDDNVYKNETKRLEDLDQLKKAESECAQVKEENATLRQMIAQLEAESASKNKNTTAEAGKARIKEDKSKLRKGWRSLKQKTRS
nr:unnamed protein product [Callosobruchus chinensis]